MAEDKNKVTPEEELQEEKIEETAEAEAEAEEAKQDENQEEQKEDDNNEDAQTESEEDKAKAAEAAESDRYLRLFAEFQNYKRRTENEKNDLYKFANEKILKDFFAVFDNFERAIEQAEAADPKIGEGMRLIFQSFVDVLKKDGCEEIEALGQEFDPNFHNAVMTEDNPDFESGKVSKVFQKGYILNGKVIRPAMVVVAN